MYNQLSLSKAVLLSTSCLLLFSHSALAQQTLSSTLNANPAGSLQGPASFGSATNSGATSIGFNSSAIGFNSSSFGNGSTANGSFGSAYGILSSAGGIFSSAFGSKTNASGFTSSTFGNSSTASGAISSAFGNASSATGVRSAAFGSFSGATGFASSAYGDNSNASGTNSSAYGTFSNASAANSVAIGSFSLANQANTVSVGTVGGERRITNVAPGIAGTDAVNVSQLAAISSGSGSGVTLPQVQSQVAAGVQQSNAYTDQQVNQANAYTNAVFQNLSHNDAALSNRIDNLTSNSYRGIACAIALVSAPRPLPGKSGLAMGTGYYMGNAAMALSMAHTGGEGRWQSSFGIATSVTGNNGANLAGGGGILFQF